MRSGGLGRHVLGLGGIALGVLAGGLAWRTAHPPLARDLEHAIAGMLQVPEERVHVGRTRLVPAPGLLVEDLRIGRLSVGSARAVISPAAALSGHARLERMDLWKVELPGQLGARAIELRLGGRDSARVSAQEVSYARGTRTLDVGELGLEIEAGRLERVAFAGARLGREHERPLLDDLAGSALHARGAGWTLRAARPGFSLSGRLEDGVLRARATVESLGLASLAPLVGPAGLRVEDARASGELTLTGSAETVRTEGRITIDGVRLDHHRLAAHPVGPVGFTLEGAVTTGEGLISLEHLELGSGPWHLQVDAEAALAGDFRVAAELREASCADLLRALPRDLVPALDGLVLDGRYGARMRLSGALSQLSQLALDYDLRAGCRVLGDPPLADVRALATPLGWRALDAAAPGWRPLPSLPVAVVRAFLVSEDSRFFQHHGFDADMIRRALAADLSLGRIDRGASTISQQLVKNLYLGDERTAARKLEEAVLTWRLEQLVPKRRILEYYLNVVEFGPGVFGIGNAAERYFGKEPEGLTADEAAQLAALLPAPRRGMDGAWEKRYRALLARLPSENLVIPSRDGVVRLSQR
jgi:hypothetical protein